MTSETTYNAAITLTQANSERGKFFIHIGIVEPDASNSNTYKWVSNPPPPPAGKEQSTVPPQNAIARVQLDTGSCGIVLPASFLYAGGVDIDPSVNFSLPPVGNLLPGVTTEGKPAHVVYQPSTDSITGFYYTIACLGIGSDENGAPQVIAKNVTVIGATNHSPFMMGIGFDRPLIGTNAFLTSCQANGGDMLYPSYYLDAGQVTLGKQDSSTAFSWQTLATTATPPAFDTQQWHEPTGTIQVNAESQPLVPTAINVLLDTGLDLMMLASNPQVFAVPDSPNPNAWAAATVNIAIDGDAGTAAQYQFTLTGIAPAQLSPSENNPVSVYTTENSHFLQPKTPVTQPLVGLDDQPDVHTAAPTLVHVITSSKPQKPFVNTGFNLLFAYGMLFDAPNSKVGFTPLNAAANTAA